MKFCHFDMTYIDNILFHIEWRKVHIADSRIVQEHQLHIDQIATKCQTH